MQSAVVDHPRSSSLTLYAAMHLQPFGFYVPAFGWAAEVATQPHQLIRIHARLGCILLQHCGGAMGISTFMRGYAVFLDASNRCIGLQVCSQLQAGC